MEGSLNTTEIFRDFYFSVNFFDGQDEMYTEGKISAFTYGDVVEALEEAIVSNGGYVISIEIKELKSETYS